MLETVCHTAGTSDPAAEQDETRREGSEKGKGKTEEERPDERNAFIQPTAPLGTDDNAFVSGKKRDFFWYPSLFFLRD